jgi:type IV pilus assembly protein PilQ
MNTTARSILIFLFAAAGAGAAIALVAIDPIAEVASEEVADEVPAKGRSEDAPIASNSEPKDGPQETPSQPAVTQQAVALPPAAGSPTSEETLLKPMLEIIGNLTKSQQTAAAVTAKPAAAPLQDAITLDEDAAESDAEEVAPSRQNGARNTPADAEKATPVPQFSDEGDGRITINCRDSEIRTVLDLLSRQGDLNIIPAKSVIGPVTASLPNVSVEEALDIIVKSAGFLWRREGKFIYVGTREDFKAIDQARDRIGTRVYHPNYATALELEQLITPLLTPTIGRMKSSSPAKAGIATDDAAAGGNDFAGAETVIVHDFETVLTVIDGIVAQIDRRPTQVFIEAMILSVRLNDEHRFGIDFEFLRNNDHVRLATGSPLNTLGQISFEDGGLKFGYLDQSLSMFLEAIETIGDTNVVATPRVLCLNRQRAEIHIGEQLGYVDTTQTETASTQSVKFLDVGTFLRIRPYISNDGTVRLEVHPELSTGVVRVEEGLTLPDKVVTKVTSNVMVRDGSTVVIGGLIRDELSDSRTQVPLLGSLPWVGPAFRSSRQSKERREIIVLITPHIVYEPEVGLQGDKTAREFHHRHMIYDDKLSPIGKRHLGRRYFHKAQTAWHQGDQERALRLINLSIHFDPLSRAAIDLRSDITSNNAQGDHTDIHPPRVGPGLHPLDGELLAPWMIAELGRPPFPLRHPVDPGTPGAMRPITPPQAAP